MKGKKAILVVARRRVSKAWSLDTLDESDGTPVVWKQPAGEYTDAYGEKKLTVVTEGLVWCGYGSWTILYAWTDGGMQKIWLSD